MDKEPVRSLHTGVTQEFLFPLTGLSCWRVAGSSEMVLTHKYLLSICYKPATVLGNGDIVTNNPEKKKSLFMQHITWDGGGGQIKQVKYLVRDMVISAMEKDLTGQEGQEFWR